MTPASLDPAPSGDIFLDLGDRRLRARRLVPARPDGLDRTTLVFLHEGLGCIEMWRDFPQRLCDSLSCSGLVYDRTGYGRSSPWPRDPGLRYMELEADEVFPRLLAAAGIDDCVLVGHSDGGTIALNKKARHDYFIEDRFEAGDVKLINRLTIEDQLFQAQGALISARFAVLLSHYQILGAMGRLRTSL